VVTGDSFSDVTNTTLYLEGDRPDVPGYVGGTSGLSDVRGPRDASGAELAEPQIPARGQYTKQSYDISRFIHIELGSFLTDAITATSHILTVRTHLRFVYRIRSKYTNVDLRNIAATVLAFRHTSSSQTIDHRPSDSDDPDIVNPPGTSVNTQKSVFATYPSNNSRRNRRCRSLSLHSPCFKYGVQRA